MIAEMNSLITKIRLLKAQTTNEHLLKEDEKILKLSFNSENNEKEKSDDEEVVTFDEKEDYELVRALEDILLTSSFSEVDAEATFHIQLSIRTNDQHQADKRNSEKVFLAISQKDFLRILLDQNQNKKDSERVFSEILQKDFIRISLDQISCEICSQKAKNQDERLKNFDMKKIMSIFNRVFAAEQQFKIHK